MLLQSSQRGGKRHHLGGRNFDAKNASKLPGQMGHAAFQPVTPMACDHLGHRLDQAGSVRAR
jgi:hypothetical protein